MKDHDSLLAQEPPLARQECRAGRAKRPAIRLPTLILVPAMPRRIAQNRLKAHLRHPR
jgi:hypothetical protein